MLRAALLYLAKQPQLRHWVETSSFAEKLTRRFVAGDTLDDAICVCRKINGEGIDCSLDHLGENITSAEEASASRDQALAAIRKIASQQLKSTISIKLTQFGLDLGEDLCLANVDPVVAAAKKAGTIVEFDMESSQYTDRTLRIVREMHHRYGCVRAVIQAYLYRSEKDIAALCAEKIPIRLCKGAYDEPSEVAFPKKADVDTNYAKLARQLLDCGTDPAFATHDERMTAIVDGTNPHKFEYQMLYGIRRDLQRKQIKRGYRLRLYIPYGDAWYPYFMRRLAERPANIWFVMRSIFRS